MKKTTILSVRDKGSPARPNLMFDFFKLESGTAIALPLREALPDQIFFFFFNIFFKQGRGGGQIYV